jgi:hypothetical protein
MASFKHAFPSEHSPAEIWQGLSTPLPEPVARTVYPFTHISYESLAKGRIMAGTHITHRPTAEALAKVPGGLRHRLPRDINLFVEGVSTVSQSRTDRLVSERAEGKIRYHVVEGQDSSGLLVVEADLTIAGLAAMLADYVIHYGVKEPSQSFIEQLDQIIG